ncbi:MAG: serine acetyltransferase [Clostridia bacterium]|nr:serine acetyltransferase [Clostridia bacterium]
MNKYIKSDLFRYTGKTDFFSFLVTYLKDKAFRYQVAFRLCQTRGISRIFGLGLYVISSNQYTKIGLNAKIGYGLYIGHNGPVIISSDATIGNNVNLSQFTTIGANNGRAATIGDNVYIGPGVSVVENVTIGDNVTIGAGSVVTKNIPENATAVGNYCKVINYNNPGRYIKNKWTIE